MGVVCPIGDGCSHYGGIGEEADRTLPGCDEGDREEDKEDEFCPFGSDPGPVAALHKQSISDDDPDQIGRPAGGSEKQELAAEHSCAQHLHKEQHFVRFDLIGNDEEQDSNKSDRLNEYGTHKYETILTILTPPH